MTVSQSAIDDIGPGGMHIGLLPGEQLELRYLLDALLVRFYRLMNEKARELGATNTNFVNPCGIDNGEKGKNHLTTARDLAKIAQYAMTIPPINCCSTATQNTNRNTIQK